MPVTTKRRGNKTRVIEKATGRIARNKAGTPVDGGGHSSKAEAQSQARAINRSVYGRPKKR